MSFFSNLLANYITGRILGGKKGGNIAAIGTAIPALLQQGLGSDGFSLDSLFGGGKQSDAATKAVTKVADPIVQKGPSGFPSADATAKTIKAANVAKDIAPVFQQGEGTLGYADFLVKSGILDPNSKVTDLLILELERLSQPL